MILQALNGYYDRVASREGAKIAPPGYSYEGISFAAVLGRDGSLIDVNDLRTSAGKKPRPLLLLVPQPPKRSGVKPPPCFLWDKTGYVFGVGRSKWDKTQATENPQYLDAFRAYHRELLTESDDAGLRALLCFLDVWKPSRYASLRYADEMLDTYVVFSLEGDKLPYLHERPVARQLWARICANAEAESGLCLITGKTLPIARLHPAIKNVRGAQSSGASIVSFNQPSFTSYGKEQGANAPVSESAAFAYTTALNDLLRENSAQKVQIGDATTLFWAEAADPKEAEVAERAVTWLFEPPSHEQLDAAETERLRTEVMERIEKGRPLEEPDLKLAKGTRFYILGLAPNAARLSVRFWEATTLGALGNAFHQHWCDLRIDGLTWRQPPALRRVLMRTAPARRNQQGVVRYDTNQVPANLAGELTRAILTGGPYPRTILSNVLMRFRSDHELDGLRIALVKAAIVRDMRRNIRDLPKETYVSLNRDDPDPAYRLGRLFAILEKTQQAALDGVNATIRDRFYGSASATPSAVFPILIRNAMHHLAGLRKGRGARWVKRPAATGMWLSQEMGNILNGLDKDWPKGFTIEAQGRFAIGYFHQRYTRGDGPPTDLKESEPEPEVDDSDTDN